MGRTKWLLTSILLGWPLFLAAQGSPYPHWTVAASKQVRVIIDSDTAVESDDQVAIAYALLSPSVRVRGVVAAHFRPLPNSSVPAEASMEASYEELRTLFGVMKVRDCVPTWRGSPRPFSDPKVPPASQGADMIIQEALSPDPRPLFVAFLGPLTDLASAYLKNPAIAEHLTAIWIGGAPYPKGGPEFNQDGDRIAANIVMESKIPMWQVPATVYLMPRFSLAEVADKVGRQGELGAFLFGRVDRFVTSRPTIREFFQFADTPAIGVLLQRSLGDFEIRPAPSITPEGAYNHGGKNRIITVFSSIDQRALLEDIFAKLAAGARGELSACPADRSR